MNVKLFRFWLGRHFIHAGLRIMPPGLVRSEIMQVLEEWAGHVLNVVEQRRAPVPFSMRQEGEEKAGEVIGS